MWCCILPRQAMNLREITKKVGRNIGLNLPAVQLFTKQLLLVSLYLVMPASCTKSYLLSKTLLVQHWFGFIVLAT